MPPNETVLNIKKGDDNLVIVAFFMHKTLLL